MDTDLTESLKFGVGQKHRDSHRDVGVNQESLLYMFKN